MRRNKKKERTAEFFSRRARILSIENIKRDIKAKREIREQVNFAGLIKRGLIAEVKSERELETLLV